MSNKSATSSIAKKAGIKKAGPKVTAKEKEQKTKKIIEAVTDSHKKRTKEEKQDESDVESDENKEEAAEVKEEENAAKESAPEAEKEFESFLELGVSQTIQDACDSMNFRKPTPIQAQSIPYA